jgi:hypothetical protein
MPLMKVGLPTIEALANVIVGCEHSPYMTGPQLVIFFNALGFSDSYGSGFPSRGRFAESKLCELNEAGRIGEAVLAAVDPRRFSTPDANVDKAVEYLNGVLEFEGFRLRRQGRKFALCPLGPETVSFQLPFKPSTPEMEEFINRQRDKCREKLAAGDHDGAITNARSLLEAVLIELDRKLSLDPKPYDGDLPKLYKRVRKGLQMDETAYKELEPVMQLLRGLTSIVEGLSGMSNRMADRHAITRQPAKHHAELAVNSATTLASFLVASFVHQRRTAAAYT